MDGESGWRPAGRALRLPANHHSVKPAVEQEELAMSPSFSSRRGRCRRWHRQLEQPGGR